MRINIQSEKDLPTAAAALLEAVGDHRLISFDGPMGAGKTTLISEICRQLGMADEASSPTFSIVNQYSSVGGGEKVYHFDFYRLENASDAYEIGVEDYFDSGSLCLMEWAGNIGEALPEETLTVRITPLEDGSRVLELPD